MNGTIAELTVLYDEQCALCRRSRDWLTTQPTHVPLRLVPSGSEDVRSQYPGVPLGEQLVVTDQNGRIWVGGPAFLMCLWATHRWRDWSYRLSGNSFQPLAERFFDFVSKRRKRISRWMERNESCEACEPESTRVRPATVHPTRPADGERLVVEVEGVAVAYSLDDLTQVGVLNGRVSDRALVVLASRGSPRRFDVYERAVNVHTLTFAEEDGMLVDAETGTTWNPRDGSAIIGPLAGSRLRRVPGELVGGAELAARWRHAQTWPP